MEVSVNDVQYKRVGVCFKCKVAGIQNSPLCISHGFLNPLFITLLHLTKKQKLLIVNTTTIIIIITIILITIAILVDIIIMIVIMIT